MLQSLTDVAVGVAVTVTVCVGSSQSAVGATAAVAVRARAATARIRVSENILTMAGGVERRQLLVGLKASEAMSLQALLEAEGLRGRYLYQTFAQCLCGTS